MDDAPFELVDKDDGCLTVRCTGCGAMHELPPLDGEPVHLECPCGHEAEFVMASPGAELAADGDGDGEGWLAKPEPESPSGSPEDGEGWELPAKPKPESRRRGPWYGEGWSWN